MLTLRVERGGTVLYPLGGGGGAPFCVPAQRVRGSGWLLRDEDLLEILLERLVCCGLHPDMER